MLPRTVVVVSILSLTLFRCGDAITFPGTQMLGTFVDNADLVGIPMPGYMKLLSNKKSRVLTRIFHYLFGFKLEAKFQKILEISIAAMDDQVAITDVKMDSHNDDELEVNNGIVKGLKTISLSPPPNTQVEIITVKGFPVFAVPVQFKNLQVEFDYKKPGTFVGYNEGRATGKVKQNNFVLKFHLYPGLFEWCYLRLFDVICTDFSETDFTARNKGGSSAQMDQMSMNFLFSAYDGTVENHIRHTISNYIYHYVPLASPAICDNQKKQLKMSHYERKKANKSKVGGILAKLKEKPAQNGEKPAQNGEKPSQNGEKPAQNGAQDGFKDVPVEDKTSQNQS